MQYTKTFNELKLLFNPEIKEISIPQSAIKIYNARFTSDVPVNDFSNRHDALIVENSSFSYPVFIPANREANRVILLLHGLNERSWIKYLVWAFYLAEQTKSYVILFPISFHINRSPASWRDPHLMINFMKTRNSTLEDVEMSSFANIAISSRLTEDPMRFFSSGYQTSSDIVKLILEIKNGRHPIIPATGSFNIFAYSIGAFLAEIMIMGNPMNLFSESKLFIFCGGSVFSNMRGTSKLIMDSRAFNRVYDYYMNDFEETILTKSFLSDFFNSSQLGMAFRSMIDPLRFRIFRETLLKKLRDQIHSISLVRDTVIPFKGIIATLNNLKNKNIVDVWDFPYSYSHENPFPVFNSALSYEVDRSFEKVFSSAAAFFSK